MKTDTQLKGDILSELEWEPAIDAANVGVMVQNGIVTLTGHLDTYAQKYAIERAIQRVEGVKAIAVELDVKLDPAHKRSDSEIAAAVEAAFKWNSIIPVDHIQPKVEKGWVTLKGDVEWHYQSRAAEKTVRPLIGVTGVTNNIHIKQQATSPSNIANLIRSALARHAEREAKNIEVMVDGGKVTLRGKVHSWAERAAIQGAAWSAPGVAGVINELEISSR